MEWEHLICAFCTLCLSHCVNHLKDVSCDGHVLWDWAILIMIGNNAWCLHVAAWDAFWAHLPLKSPLLSFAHQYSFAYSLNLGIFGLGKLVWQRRKPHGLEQSMIREFLQVAINPPGVSLKSQLQVLVFAHRGKTSFHRACSWWTTCSRAIHVFDQKMLWRWNTLTKALGLGFL